MRTNNSDKHLKRRVRMKYIIFYIIVICLGAHYSVAAHYGTAKKLDILMVTDKFPYSARPFINNQLKGLMDKGHRIWIWCTSPRQASEAALPQCLQGYPLENKIFYRDMPVKRNYDIILCQFGDKGSLALEKKKLGQLSGKIVTFFRGEDLTARLHKKPHRYDELFAQGDLFLPVCYYFKKIVEDFGAQPDKTHVIHSAIDCRKFFYREHPFDASGPIELISVSRLTEKKGSLFSIMAVALLKHQYPSLQYTIVGEGPMRPFLTHLINVLHAQEYIHLVGERPHHEIADLLDKSHIFILHSITADDQNQEGIPNVLMEAMAIGLPVVSTFHAGIPELVHDGKSGLLVPEKDVVALMEKIEYLLAHPDECVRMGKVGRAYVEKEHNTIIANNVLEKLLLKLV